MWIKYLAIVTLIIILTVLLKLYMVKSTYRKKIASIENEIEFLEKERSYHGWQIGALTMAGEDMQGEYMNMVACEEEIKVLKEKLSDQKLIWASENK